MLAESALRDRLGASHGLIETLRWEPPAGLVQRERHLARMAASARTFAIPFCRDRAEEALTGVTTGDMPLRVRLVLSVEGMFEAAAAPFDPPSQNVCWRLAIARTRISSSDPLNRHKTTMRALYGLARGELTQEEADEVVLLNEREEVCEGTVTNIFLDVGPGRLLTPALRCGLLPSVLRAELVESGKAVETG